MGWNFGGTKIKWGTRLTRESRRTWNPRLNFNNRVQEYSPKTTWFYSKIVWHQPCFLRCNIASKRDKNMAAEQFFHFLIFPFSKRRHREICFSTLPNLWERGKERGKEKWKERGGGCYQGRLLIYSPSPLSLSHQRARGKALEIPAWTLITGLKNIFTKDMVLFKKLPGCQLRAKIKDVGNGQL